MKVETVALGTPLRLERTTEDQAMDDHGTGERTGEDARPKDGVAFFFQTSWQ